MAHGTDDLSVDWYAPDPRAVIPLEPQGFHIRRSLAKQIRRKPFEIRVDTQFEAVIRACAKPRPGEGGDVWLSEMLISAYVDLAKRGHAHSIEAWHDNTLVGGIYGVCFGGLFCGESMFSRAPYASQLCLVHLVSYLRHNGHTLFDVQFVNDHLVQFGVIELSRHDYEQQLANALTLDTSWNAP